ncbi:K(+) efflux antiporter 2, chloroplastic-like [Camellia sinensis]|uniref:K(+) efflux antiporter 2, chloroplastic-like n=1 Tax=Camellia sinensis TaxID=4442 RepID=UPI001036C6CE|nr:K(+) efflux antiporter 2, chloroplastic-like [Camellia sinensis]
MVCTSQGFSDFFCVCEIHDISHSYANFQPLRPIYKQVSENQNAEIFSANTLLVILGTSLLTARVGLSMTLGAFLAGLLLAETRSSLLTEAMKKLLVHASRMISILTD